MRKALPISFVLLFSVGASGQNLKAPNGKLSLSFELRGDGEPTYQLSFGGEPVIQKSSWEFELKELASLTKGFTLLKVDHAELDETWNGDRNDYSRG